MSTVFDEKKTSSETVPPPSTADTNVRDQIEKLNKKITDLSDKNNELLVYFN